MPRLRLARVRHGGKGIWMLYRPGVRHGSMVHGGRTVFVFARDWRKKR
jgi:hypothetical protein